MNDIKNKTVLYLLENYHELRYKRINGTLYGYLESKVKTLEDMFCDEELINYRNSAFKVIIHHYRDGLSYEKIAEKMNIGVSTVYKYRNYELERLSWVFEIPVK